VTSPGNEINAQESAIETARALAKDGRVVLVSLAQDLSHLHEQDGRENHLGLTDLLVGHASFAEVIHRDADSPVHFIPAGQAPDRGLDGFDLVLDALCHTYDFIVLLAGAVAAESDAITLAPQVNSVILAASGTSSEEAAAKAYGDLVEAGARDVVLVGRDAGSEQTAA
jgi:polysaccharide biosynthesis transport protein